MPLIPFIADEAISLIYSFIIFIDFLPNSLRESGQDGHSLFDVHHLLNYSLLQLNQLSFYGVDLV